jgi:hypothetical protein
LAELRLWSGVEWLPIFGELFDFVLTFPWCVVSAASGQFKKGMRLMKRMTEDQSVVFGIRAALHMLVAVAVLLLCPRA